MPSPFARDTKVIDLPFDPPNTATIRQLNGRQLAKASSSFFNNLVREIVERGGAKVQKEIEALWKKETPKDDAEKGAIAAEVAAVQADPLNGYDLYQLCYDGLTAWSYKDSLTRVPTEEQNAAGQTVTVMRIPAIDDLGDEALRFFATEILRLSKPALFQTPAEVAEAQKND